MGLDPTKESLLYHHSLINEFKHNYSLLREKIFPRCQSLWPNLIHKGSLTGNVGLGTTKNIRPWVYLSSNYMETGHFPILLKSNISSSCDVVRGPRPTSFNPQQGVLSHEFGIWSFQGNELYVLLSGKHLSLDFKHMVLLLSHLFNINHLVTALLNEDGIAHMLKVKHLIKCFVTALCTVPCSTSKRHFSRFRKLWREPSAAVWLSFYSEQILFLI